MGIFAKFLFFNECTVEEPIIFVNRKFAKNNGNDNHVHDTFQPSPPSTGTCVPSTTVTTPRTTPAANMPPASAPSQCCPTGGIWSEWGPRLNCTDICGAFGTAVRLRTCLTSPGGCPCTGSARTTVPCAFLPCTYPRNSCASGFKVKLEN